VAKRSSRGTRIYAELLGFKEFFERTEKPVIERILKKNPDYPFKYLPYAVALKITDLWFKKFHSAFEEPPNWFKGDISRIHVSFSQSVASTFSPSTQAAGGSFGTGVSGGTGGGIGGGGGGSW